MTLKPLHAAIALALWVPAQTLWAETSPYSLTVSQTFEHHDNLLWLSDRAVLPSGFSKSDTVSVTRLLATFNQPISRQRLFASADVNLNRYSNNSIYNDVGYQLKLGADWATVNRLSGNVTLSAARAQRPTLRTQDSSVIDSDNPETARQLRANVVYGANRRLALEAGAGRRQLRYGANASRFREYDEDAVDLATRYQFSGALNTGAIVRHTTTTYPQLLTTLANPEDRRKRTDIGVTAQWQPSGATTVSGQLTQTAMRYDQVTQRDFDTLTGFVAMQYNPGGRWRAEARLIRDAGKDDSALVTTATSNTRTTDTLALSASYQLTGKTFLDGGLRWASRSLDRGDGLSGSDQATGLTLGLTWQYSRGIAFRCGVNSDRRGTNSVAALNEAFSATSFGCAGSLTLN